MSDFDKFIDLDINSTPLKVGVIGDAMIDEYFNVKIKKISPEFPIPVMHSNEESSLNLPGGAANVIYQFKNFNINPYLISFTDDESNKVFKDNNINSSICCNISEFKCKIPRKKRFYNDDFPTYRWDVESNHNDYGLNERLDSCCSKLFDNALIHNFDVTIFSDYNKGLFFNSYEKIQSLIKKSKISIVDPKSKDIEKWKGCTVFKPNKSEALFLSGCDNVQDAGFYFLSKLGCQAVVITQGGDGVSVFDKNGLFEIIPKKKSIAESVIGAGDCYTSFLAMALGRGLDVRTSASIAWKAGGKYVKNKHNKPLEKIDIISSKIISRENIDLFIGKDVRNYTLSFTNGCFDILHSDHTAFLKFTKSQGDKLVVAVNSDESVSRIKEGRPIIPLKNRMELLASLESVDFVVVFDEDTPLNLMKKVCPDVIVKGSDYQANKVVGSDLFKVAISPLPVVISTTQIIDKIKSLN